MFTLYSPLITLIKTFNTEERFTFSDAGIFKLIIDVASLMLGLNNFDDLLDFVQ